VSPKECESGMETGLRVSFAYDPKAMTKASFEGKPLASADPKHKIISDLYGLCKEMAGVPEESKGKTKGFALFKRGKQA
jgi:Flp pilus assembly CpaE family ATPase